jgi:outer membrane receptor for ferric coprogen and ferric-rhodotorulic acid
MLSPDFVSPLRQVLSAALLTTAAMSWQPLVMAAESNAETRSNAPTKQQFNQQRYALSQGPLSQVLSQFAGSANVALSFSADQLSNIQSPGLQGSYSVTQGFDKLLQGSGLIAVEKSSGNYALQSTTADVSALDLVKVIGRYTDRSTRSATGIDISLRETPQSVSVISIKRLEDQNLRSITDVVNNTTGLSAIEMDSTRHNYSSRGFDISNIQIDGTPIAWEGGAEAGETQSDVALYERIEVVRGATGLLTGAGDPSASINLVRKHADSKKFTGSASLTASRWNTYNSTVDLSTPINDDGSVRGRIVASYEDSESYVDLAENKKNVFYGVIDADITDRTSLSAGASYQDNDPSASTWGGLSSWYSDGSRTDWKRSKTTAADWTHWGTTNETYFINLAHEFTNGWEIKLNTNHTENSADLRLLYIYGQADKTTGQGLNPFPARYDLTRKQDDINLQVNGYFTWLNREHDVTFGATDSSLKQKYYAYDSSNVAAVGDFNKWDGSYQEPTWGKRNLRDNLDTKQNGFYAATRLSLTESFNVILGGRVADWKRKGLKAGNSTDYGDNGVFIPYAGAVYDINHSHTAYASYTEIFKPQNNQDRHGNFLDPLTGKSYEAGLKSAFFNDGLNTTLAIFNIEQDNLAQADTAFSTPENKVFNAIQGTESKGYELEVVGALQPNWNVNLGYTEFIAEDTEGEDVNTDHPRKLLKLFSTYDFSGTLEKLTLGGGANWQGSTYADVTNPITGANEKLEQKAYALVNIMARYDISKQLSSQLNIDNLLDKTYYSQVGFFSQLAYGEPRNISLKMTYDF